MARIASLEQINNKKNTSMKSNDHVFLIKKNSMKPSKFFFLIDLGNYGSCKRKTRQEDEILTKKKPTSCVSLC